MSIGASLGLDQINYMASISSIIYWIIYAMLGLFIILGLWAAYYWLSFTIKATVFPLYGSGKDGVFSVGKPKSNKLKWVKHRTAWRSLYPLFNKIDREPFDAEFIYPSKKVYVFDMNGNWSPGRINISQSEENVRAEIGMIPYWVRNWQALEHKQNAIDFAKHDFWSDNKNFIWMLLAVGICCTMCVVTVWLTYKFSAPSADMMSKLTGAIQSISGSAGAPQG